MTNDEQTFVENLKQSGALSNADLTKASNMRSHTLGQSLSHWLVKLGLSSDDEVAKAWSYVLAFLIGDNPE